MHVALPAFLLRVIDPAGAYLSAAERAVDPRRPLPRRAALCGPDLPDGVPTDDEVSARVAEHRHRSEAAEDVVRQQWGPVLREAADELLARGSVTVHLGERTIDARIIRFWRGDSLLATRSRGPEGGGESMSRIRRNARRESPEVLSEYLVRAATKG